MDSRTQRSMSISVQQKWRNLKFLLVRVEVESQSKVMNKRVASVLYCLLHSCFGKVDINNNNNDINIENTDADHFFMH